MPRLLNQVPVIRLDIVRPKLARGHFTLEHDVHLLECASLRLWQTEPAPDGCEEGQRAPEESLEREESKSVKRIDISIYQTIEM